MLAEPLRFRDPVGDRFELVVRVERDGAWTPGLHVTLDAGNQVELTEAELTWLVETAGPHALGALALLREGLQGGRRPGALSSPGPSTSGERPEAARSPNPDEPPRQRPSSSAAGQGVPSDPRPEPAAPSSEPEEA